MQVCAVETKDGTTKGKRPDAVKAPNRQRQRLPASIFQAREAGMGSQPMGEQVVAVDAKKLGSHCVFELTWHLSDGAWSEPND